MFTDNDLYSLPFNRVPTVKPTSRTATRRQELDFIKTKAALSRLTELGYYALQMLEVSEEVQEIIADTHSQLGHLRSLNELARNARADYIIHTGDFGFYDESSLDRIAEK